MQRDFKNLSSALDKTLPLLRPEARSSEMRTTEGYLDLLEESPVSTGLSQDLMLTRVVPMIYERWWRPAFGRLAKGIRGPSMADEYRIARLLLGLVEGDGVLDVACGPGNFSRHFAEAVGQVGLVVGIDASEPMLKRAVRESKRLAHDNLAFVRGNAIELPFRDSSFDAVCCFGALHLFSDPFKALDSMTAVLTPGGRIAILTSCRGRTGTVRAVESLWEARSGMRMFEEAEIVNALEERGFSEIRQTVTGTAQIVGGRLGEAH